MDKYNNALVYKITSLSHPEICYIGSTCLTLKQRLAKHKSQFKRYKETGKQYYTSFKILEYDDYFIELIEKISCESRKELSEREGFYIRSTIECVNKRIAGRTQKEYEKTKYKLNKEAFAEKHKIYYQNNKLILNEKANLKHSCECGGKFTTCTKSVHFKTKLHQNFLTSQQTTQL